MLVERITPEHMTGILNDFLNHVDDNVNKFTDPNKITGALIQINDFCNQVESSEELQKIQEHTKRIESNFKGIIQQANAELEKTKRS